MPPSILADDKHLTKMGLRLSMALEAVLISALLLTDLAVPPQALQALGFHLIGQILWSSDWTLNVSGIRSDNCQSD
jgi:hypothetical protein